MKKILLSAALCAAALFTGCTKDVANGGDEQDGNTFKITGIIEGNTGTRVVLGDADGAATSTEVLWEFEDMIGVHSTTWLDTEIHQTKPQQVGNAACRATTVENSTTTGFKQVAQGSINPKNFPGVTYWAYYPYSSGAKTAVTSPLKTVQTYDKLTGKYPDKMFMVTSETTPNSKNEIAFKFRNTFAMINVALKGDALIDSIEVGGFTKLVACDNATLDITKAPVVGTNATDFMASGFFKRAEGDNAEILSVKFKFPEGTRLTDNAIKIPIMILPTEYAAAEGITLTVYGTDHENKVSKVVKTFGKNTSGSIKTNDIVYLNPEAITIEDLAQRPPRTEIEPGETIFEDDFSWLPTAMKDFNGVSGTVTKYLKSGWVNYSYTDKTATYTSVYSAELNKQEFANKYMVGDPATAINGLYNNNGMVIIGDETVMSGGSLTIPIDLEKATSDLEITFKAAQYVDNKGEVSQMVMSPNLDIIVTGPGTIKGGVETKATITPDTKFKFKEYTVVVVGATSETKIEFCTKTDNPYFLGMSLIDDIKIVTATPEATNKLIGKEIARPEAALVDFTPENGEISIGWAQGATTSFTFSMLGKWEIIDAPEWLVFAPQWAHAYTTLPTASILKDELGNDMSNIMNVWAKETNSSTTNNRSATLTLKSTENPSITKTFTITQALQPAKTLLFSANFGTVTKTTPLTRGMNFGITHGADMFLDNFDDSGKNTRGELTNETAIRDYISEVFGDKPLEALGFEYLNCDIPGATVTDGFYNFKTIAGWEMWDKPKAGIGVIFTPELMKTYDYITVSFNMFLGFDGSKVVKDGYNKKKPTVNVYGTTSHGIEFKNTARGWKNYTLFIPMPPITIRDNKEVPMEIWIFPPTDSRETRENSVLIDDIKIEVQ